MIKRLVLASFFTLVTHSSACSQDGWQRLFPGVHYFDPLIADPIEPRMGLAMIQTNVFESAGQAREIRFPFAFPDSADSAHDVQVVAGIGGSIPLLRLKEWPGKGGIVASAQLGVFARFRIEYPTREEAATDWFVGMPFEITYEKFTGRFRIMHRSSHIGDELVQTAGAERIEFGGEYADFIAAYQPLQDLRVYGGATYNFRSYNERLLALRLRDWHDHTQVQAGFDYGSYRWSNGHVGVVAGFDWQSTQRTNWRSGFSVVGGLAVKTNGRGSKLIARYYHGPSTMGEFFLTPETFTGIEWVVDF
jgi:hypothetical protein